MLSTATAAIEDPRHRWPWRLKQTLIKPQTPRTATAAKEAPGHRWPLRLKQTLIKTPNTKHSPSSHGGPRSQMAVEAETKVN
jgi:hypothetical protein